MKLEQLRAALPPVVIFVAFVVLVLGYGMGHEWLTTVIPGANSMKPVTALSFVASGFLVQIAYGPRRLLSGSMIVGLLSYMMALGVAGWAGLSHALGLAPGFSTIEAGPPSVGTLVAFGVVELIGLRAVLGRRPLPLLGWLLVAFGASSTIGYLLGLPLLYFEHPNSSAMAIHTGLLFIALGVTATERPSS